MTLFEQLGAAIKPQNERYTIYKPSHIDSDGVEYPEKRVMSTHDEQLAIITLKHHAADGYNFCLVKEVARPLGGFGMCPDYGIKFYDDL